MKRNVSLIREKGEQKVVYWFVPGRYFSLGRGFRVSVGPVIAFHLDRELYIKKGVNYINGL